MGGNEFGQLYQLDLKTLQSTLLTDGGRSQNGGITWRADGKGFYFSSTKRNGGDRDIYYMDPKNPSAAKMVLQVKGGGWGILDISKDNSQLLIGEYISANESHIWSLVFIKYILFRPASLVINTSCFLSSEKEKFSTFQLILEVK